MISSVVIAQPPKRSGPTKPTFANVAYGTHKKQVLDFYQAEADGPTPLVFFIHGGGWGSGDKRNIVGLDNYLQAGISVVSIEYRFIQEAAGVSPPVRVPFYDAARALQFVRNKAADWNIDNKRIAASGVSAGGCSSLWLAFHPDLADPDSDDPIARQSTRLYCAAVKGAQTSLDPQQMRDWIPGSFYGGHAFGYMRSEDQSAPPPFEQFLADRDKLLRQIAEYSPYALLTPDDPPIYLWYHTQPQFGKRRIKDPTHSANFGVKLKEKCETLGVPCQLVHWGSKNPEFNSLQAYLIDRLKSPTNGDQR